MKIIKKLNPIQESISKIGETKKSLKEEKEVPLVGVLPNADAVALNQHIEDRKQGLERRANPDKDPLVKEFIDETASEKSRTLHYDVVDRKELAKVLTEAKKNKQKFKVGKSDKLGYRYFVDIFPVYGSQGALEVDDDSTEVDGESEESLSESLKGTKSSISDIKNAVEYSFGLKGKERDEYIKKASPKTLDSLVDGWKENSKRSFMTDSLQTKKQDNKQLDEDLEQEFKEYVKWCKENGKDPKDGKSLMDYFKPAKELKEDLDLTGEDAYEYIQYEMSDKERKELFKKHNGRYPKDMDEFWEWAEEYCLIEESLNESVQGKYSERLWNALDQGILDYETVAEAAIRYLSDDDVEDLARANDWTFVFEDPEDEDDDDYFDDDLEYLNEDLQLYTTSLKDFKPAKKAEPLWNEIIEKGKLDDLEYALENVFKGKDDKNTSIDIEGLNDLLVNEQDFIRTLIRLDDAPLEDDDYNEKPVGENEMVYPEDDEEPVDEDTPIEADEDEEVDTNDIDGIDVDEEDEEIEPIDYKVSDYDEDDVPPVEDDEDELEEILQEASSAERKAYKIGGETFDDLAQGKAIARIKNPKAREAAVAAIKAGRKDVVKNFTGDRKLNQADNAIIDKFYKMQKAGLAEDEKHEESELKLENKEQSVVECDDSDNDLIESIANGFINKNFKETSSLNTTLDTQKDSIIKESLKTNDEEEVVVDVSDEEITEALGMPKEDETKDKKEQSLNKEKEEKIEECKDGKAQ